MRPARLDAIATLTRCGYSAEARPARRLGISRCGGAQAALRAHESSERKYDSEEALRRGTNTKLIDRCEDRAKHDTSE
jgi:hypothetical protein